MDHDLLDFWFRNEDNWFGCTTGFDALVAETYGHLLGLSEVDYSTCDPLVMVKYIILFDQVSRHVARHNNTKQVMSHKHNALYFCRKLITSGLLDSEELLPKHHMFALMPLRHTFEMSNLKCVLEIVKKYRLVNPHDSYYRRFYYATIKAIAKILTVEASSKPINRIDPAFPFDILDKARMIPNWTKTSGFPGFLKCTLHDCASKSKEYRALIEAFRKLPRRKYTVSLSGGVDSMICTYVMKTLGFDFDCVMISYGNRDCCEGEIDMVYMWTQALGVDLYVRSITEISRSRDHDREFYEAMTKTIRYNMYKALGNPVIIGHNFDDSIENIFTNIMKGQKYDNLLGVKFKIVTNDVTVFRPMLDIKKTTIFGFANDHKVPYLYDSTPRWMMRGNMRDNLMPFVDEFDPTIIPGLCRMGKYFTEIHSDFHRMIVESNVATYDDKSKCIVVRKSNPSSNTKRGNYGTVYWRTVFDHLKDAYGIPHVSKKSLNNFVGIVNNPLGKTRIVNLHKTLNGKLHPCRLVIPWELM